MSDNLSFNKETNTLTVGHVEGVDYMIAGQVVNGEEVKLTRDTYVTARPQPGKVFPRGTQARWKFEVNQDLVNQERAAAVESAQAERTAARQVARAADPVETRVQPDQTAPRGGGTTPSPGTSATSAGAAGGGGDTTP